MDEASNHQPVVHNEYDKTQATAAPFNTQPSPPGQAAGSGGDITIDDPHHNQHSTAVDRHPDGEQHTDGGMAGPDPAGNGHSIVNEQQQQQQQLPAIATDNNAASEMQPSGDTMHTAVQGSDQDASLDFSQTPATHKLPAGLASRLSHLGHNHASSTKPGSFAQQDIAGRQLSEDELRTLFTMDVSSGQVVPTPLQLFLKYNCSGSGRMNVAEFAALVRDVDGLYETPQHELEKYSLVQFRQADMDMDGMIGMDDFFTYYYLTLCWKFPNHKAGINSGADLFSVFVKSSSVGSSGRLEEMGQHQFQHVCKHSKLLDGKRLTQVEVDIVYSRAKGAEKLLKDYLPLRASGRCTSKLYYPQFLFALQHVATIKRITFLQVVALVLKNTSPLPLASCSDLIIMQGPRNSTDAQVEAEEVLLRPVGLPQSQAANERAYMSRMVSDSKIEVMLRSGQCLQVKPGRDSIPHTSSNTDPLQEGTWLNTTGQSFGLSKKGTVGLADPQTMHTANPLSTDQLMIALKQVFEVHNRFKGGLDKSDMDRHSFIRCIRDCGLLSLGGDMNCAQMDMIFTRLASAGKCSLNFLEFLEALRQVARSEWWVADFQQAPQ